MVRAALTTSEDEGSREPSEMTRAPLSVQAALLLARSFAMVPFPVRSALGWLLGYSAGLLPLRERTLTELQLKAFLPDAFSRSHVSRVFANAGQTLLESLSLQPIIRARPEVIECDTWEQVQSWLSDSRPLIALTGHTGNWDLLAAFVISRGVPLTTIGREARSPAAQAVLRWIREGYGIETIWRSDRSGLKRLVQCLRERRVVAALIDQDTRVESISIPFFGSPAKTPVSLITLGKKMNARFVSAFLFRTGCGRYKTYIQEIPDLPTEYDILSRYHQHLESLVRQFPDQWVWFHKRWRTGSDGVTLSSKEYITWLQHKGATRP